MREKVLSIMNQVFEEEITEKSSRETMDKWDSIAHLDLIVELESQLGVSFTPEEMGSIYSYLDLIHILEKKT